MYHRVEISPLRSDFDPQGSSVLTQIREFLHLPVEGVRTRQAY